ncbi:MAG: HD domain-containing protein [Thermomicrobiales bacterium]
MPYSSEDLALLRTVANQLAVATENAQLYGRMRDLYLSGVRTLAATVDAKDSYTHGHSERVAAYSRAIAVALGLPQIEIETIELAGLLHDLGKIGVPDAVLQKPGKLDPDERALIEQHAELGARILADNPALLPLVPLVRHHHERFDGKGYPSGIGGDAIPLGAAIISIADTYDTMTTDRPYRRAPGHERARDEIVRCGGGQFRPDVVEAFLKAIESSEWRATAAQTNTHQARGSHLAARLAGANTRAMNIVYQIAQTIGDVTDLPSFTMRVVELLRRELGTRSVDIFLLDDASGEYHQSTPLPGMEPLRVPPGGGLIGWVAQHQSSARVDDTREDIRVLLFDGQVGGSEVAVPLISQGRAFGVINVESPRVGTFTEEDETVLVMVARQLSQVLEVAHLHDQVKRTATQDGLTGIANYRTFYGRLEAELERAEGGGSPLALILIDVNGLKQLNDNHGHLAGDGAIRRIAHLLHEARRGRTRRALRWRRVRGDPGGLDEVGQAAREGDHPGGARHGDVRFRGQLLTLPGISYGVATYGIDGDRTLSLVAAADARMYTQKVNYYAAERRPRLSVVESFAGEGEALRGRVESEQRRGSKFKVQSSRLGRLIKRPAIEPQLAGSLGATKPPLVTRRQHTSQK